MSRLFGALVLGLSLFSVSPAFANNGHGDGRGGGRDHAPGQQKKTTVPELSGGGTAAGLGLIAGAAAIALGRRRSRRAPARG